MARSHKVVLITNFVIPLRKITIKRWIFGVTAEPSKDILALT